MQWAPVIRRMLKKRKNLWELAGACSLFDIIWLLCRGHYTFVLITKFVLISHYYGDWNSNGATFWIDFVAITFPFISWKSCTFYLGLWFTISSFNFFFLLRFIIKSTLTETRNPYKRCLYNSHWLIADTVDNLINFRVIC